MSRFFPYLLMYMYYLFHWGVKRLYFFLFKLYLTLYGFLRVFLKFKVISMVLN